MVDAPGNYFHVIVNRKWEYVKYKSMDFIKVEILSITISKISNN
jgi:hypothetical protein